MRKDVMDAIRSTAKEAAQEVVSRQRTMYESNLYRATERLLYNYKAMRAQVEDRETYMMIPNRSTSITGSPTGKTVYQDRSDALEAAVHAREVSYQRTRARFEEIDAVVQQFAQKREFIVIRMYYFNEDAHGNDRRDTDKKCTFEDIQYELAAAGMEKSERTIRGWRTRIVQDMAIRLFGIDGAISIETRRQEAD